MLSPQQANGSQVQRLLNRRQPGLKFPEARAEMFDSAIQKQTTKILVDALAVRGDLFESERLQVALEVTAHLEQHRFKPRLAVVGHPPAIDGFCVRIFKMFGYDVEAFANRIDALAWLDSAG